MRVPWHSARRRLRQAKLPLPKTNKPAGGKRVDCRWEKEKLTVELLSYQFHNSRYSWEQDHERRHGEIELE